MNRRFKKEKNFEAVCRYCTTSFQAADIKCKTCDLCKLPRPCLCGCKTMVKTPGFTHAKGCKSRGKTYLEIYGTSNPTCGAKIGDLNTAKNLQVRQKISKSVKESYSPDLRQLRSDHATKKIRDRKSPFGKAAYALKYINTRNERFRSQLEIYFSELLIRNRIEYKYEVVQVLKSGRTKIVDFLVEDVFIEITGFAYINWQKDFIAKIKDLRSSIDNPILILTYPQHLEKDLDLESSIYQTSSQNVSVCSIYNDNRILQNIKFYQQVYSLNKEAICKK